MKTHLSERGIVLPLVLANIVMIMTIMGVLGTANIGTYKLAQSVGDSSVRSFNFSYVAREEAKWRESANFTDDMQPIDPMGFTNDAWDPQTLYMDVDTFTFSIVQRPQDDCWFDIGPKVNGFRPINSGGLNQTA